MGKKKKGKSKYSFFEDVKGITSKALGLSKKGKYSTKQDDSEEAKEKRRKSREKKKREGKWK